MAEQIITIPNPPTPEEKCDACGQVCCPVYTQCVSENTGLNLNDVTTKMLNLANAELKKCIGIDCYNELCQDIKFAKQEAKLMNQTLWIQYVSEMWREVLLNEDFKQWYSYLIEYNFLCSPAGQKEIEIKDEKAGRTTKIKTNEKTQMTKISKAIEDSLGLFINGCWGKIKHNFACTPKKEEKGCSPCGTKQNTSLGWASSCGKNF